MKGFEHALSLFFRRGGRWLALVVAVGGLARAADFHWSGLSEDPYTGYYSMTIDIRRAPATPSGYEIKVTVAQASGSAIYHWGVYAGSYYNPFATNQLDSTEHSQGVWYPMFAASPETTPYITFDVNDNPQVSVLWPPDGYRLLHFELTNTAELWREAGIFATEAPGTMWFRRRVGPLATVEFDITVEATDTAHYYAAFVDVAATNANNPTSVTVEGVDGKQMAVYQGVVPDASTATGEKTVADGDVAELGSGSNLVTGGVPSSRVPQPSIPAATGVATNAHLTAVTEGLAAVVQGGDRAVEAAVRDLGAQTNAHASAIEGLLSSLRGDVQAGNDLLTEINDRSQSEKERIDQALAANPTVGEMSAAGADASAEIRSVYGTRPTGKGYTLNASGAPNLTVAMPAAFGGQTFDLNPFQAGRFQALCTWFRAATAWLVIGLLGGWVWSRVGEWTRGFSTLAQARGNAVVAGTGAQGTALVAAGLITVAIVTGTTTILSWAFDDINFAAFVAVATTNPLATIPAGILWMLDQVLPVATIITAFVARITFNIYASTVFAGAAAVVRFIVP